MHATGKRKFAKQRIFSRAVGNVQFAIRKWSGKKHSLLYLFWFVVITGLLAYLGPFGTWASLAVPDRLLFWTAALGANWLVGHIAFTVTIRSFRARSRPIRVGLVLAALAAAVPGTAAVWLVVAFYLDHRPYAPSEIIEIYTQVCVLHLIIGSLVFHLTERMQRGRDAGGESSSSSERAENTSPATPEAALLARLPVRTRAELLHLRMQDHYVEVHTAAGSELLLLRFRDALREVEGVDGLQVHRSHWVARNAVVGVDRRGGGRVALRLVNGSKVPVSRSFAPALKAQGWI